MKTFYLLPEIAKKVGHKTDKLLNTFYLENFNDKIINTFYLRMEDR